MASLPAAIKHSLASTFERDRFKNGQEPGREAVASQEAEGKQRHGCRGAELQGRWVLQPGPGLGGRRQQSSG